MKVTRTPDRALRAMVRAAARPDLAATCEPASVWRKVHTARTAQKAPKGGTALEDYRALGLAWMRVEKASAGPAAPTWRIALVEAQRHGSFLVQPGDVVCRLVDGLIAEAFLVRGAVPGGTKSPPFFAQHFIEPVDIRELKL